MQSPDAFINLVAFFFRLCSFFEAKKLHFSMMHSIVNGRKTTEMLNGTVHGDSLRPVILSGALMQVSYRTVCVSVCQRLIPRR